MFPTQLESKHFGTPLETSCYYLTLKIASQRPKCRNQFFFFFFESNDKKYKVVCVKLEPKTKENNLGHILDLTTATEYSRYTYFLPCATAYVPWHFDGLWNSWKMQCMSYDALSLQLKYWFELNIKGT